MDRLFESFFLGGFECATHRRRDGLQVDVIAGTEHDARAAEDYMLLRGAGIRTVRDGLRWHLIERAPGAYDWTSFLPMLEASIVTRTQVIWDLCHWGIPAGLDVFSPDFAGRFAAFAGAAAAIVRSRSGAVPFYCAMNEISFWSWVGGDVECFYPYQTQHGDRLKRQLVAAAVAGMRAIREVDRRARFVQAEPIIHIVADPSDAEAMAEAGGHTASQYDAWDMLRGDRAPELGGEPGMLDVIGVNFYWNNEWVHHGEKTPPGNQYHKPLHVMLLEIWERYGRPIMIAETGAEGGAAIGWLGYIAAEVRQALRLGVPVEGICLYPVMDYPGWDDGRHCECGLIALDDAWRERRLRPELAAEIALQEKTVEIVRGHMASRDLQEVVR